MAKPLGTRSAGNRRPGQSEALKFPEGANEGEKAMAGLAAIMGLMAGDPTPFESAGIERTTGGPADAPGAAPPADPQPDTPELTAQQMLLQAMRPYAPNVGNQNMTLIRQLARASLGME